MTAAGDFSCARAFRNQARIWSHTEFADHVDKISRNVVVHPLEAPDIDAGLQLPHNGGLIPAGHPASCTCLLPQGLPGQV